MNRSNNGRCVNQLTPLEVDMGSQSQSNEQHLDTIEGYLKQFLCKPHQDLGRRGVICPMVPVAIKKDTLYISFYQCNGDIERIKSIVMAEKARFEQLSPTTGSDTKYKSLMICFTDLAADGSFEVIDKAQQQLQNAFVVDGLMIGEFHSAPPNKGGLWNEDFRPLHCPLPMLVIREMMNMDILFLKDNPFTLEHYLSRFSESIPDRFKPAAIANAKKFGIPLDLHIACPQVLSALDEHQADYQIHRHLKRRDYQNFVDGLTQQQRLTQTLLVKSVDCDTHAFVVADADNSVDLAAIAAKLSVRELIVLPAQEVEHKTGYPNDAVTPIGQRNYHTFVDESLLSFSSLTTGGGINMVSIELAPKDLLAVCDATVVQLHSH